MKKLLVITLAAVLLLAGCANNTAQEETKAEAAAETEAAAADDGSVLDKDSEGNYVKPENLGTVNKLGQYKGLEVDVEEISVPESDVDEEIEALLKSDAEETAVDRAAEIGDVCAIDYEGKKDGAAFEGGTGSYDLELGSHSFIEGFEDGLVGAKAGETRDLDLTFPEDYGNAELAGQAVVFTVKVNEVREKKIPELTDDWVKTHTNGQMNTIDEYRTFIREQLETYHELDVKSAAQNKLVTEILNNSDITVTNEAIEYYYQKTMQQYEKNAEAYGMDVDTYIDTVGRIDPDAFRLQLSYYAEESVKQQLMNEAIIEAEGLKIGDADYQAVADLYGYDVETMKSLFGDDFDDFVKSYKIINYIYDEAEKK